MDCCSGNDQSVNILQKKDLLAERLKKRDDNRIAELNKKKERENSYKTKYETVDFFELMFSNAQQKLINQLDASSSIDAAEAAEYFNVVFQDLNRMRKFLADSTYYLPQRNIMKAQDSLLALQNLFEKKKEEIFPKKKFAFSSKKKLTENTVGLSSSKLESVNTANKVQYVVLHIFCDEDSKVLTKSEEDVNSKDLDISRLKNCVVILKGNPAALHINNLTDCKIFCGPVSGSIFITECINCVFVLACQQLRIHKTIESQFYIHVTSKAIIEDCKLVSFAPYNWHYSTIDSHYQSSQLNTSVNNWNLVDDFNWLAVDLQSPNWSIITEEDRTSWEELDDIN